MDRKQTATLLTLLQSSYPNKADGLTDPVIAEVWHRALADIDFEVAKTAVTKWVMTEKWPPTIADLRETALEVISDEIMDWSEAWANVIHAVRSIGPYREAEAMDRFDDVTRETVRRIRFATLCEMESDQRDIMRAQFRDIYNQIANRKRESEQIPLALKDRIDAMQIGVPAHERKLLNE